MTIADAAVRARAPHRIQDLSPAEGRPRLAPVVLIHGGMPWQENGGSVFLDAVAEYGGRPCVHVAISLEGHAIDVPRGFQRPVAQVVTRRGIRGLGVLRRLSPWMHRQVYWGVVSPRSLAAQCRAMARQVAVWRPHRLAVFLNSVEVPVVARELARRTHVPYATMEWDLLDVAVRRLGLMSPLRERAIRCLDVVRRDATSRGVASEGMEAMYRDRWGLEAIILRQSARSYPQRPGRDARRPFVIAVCGNVYAVREFKAFIQALDRANWTIAGRPIDVRVIGTVDPDVGPLPARVRVTGWVPFAESLKQLIDADLGYCPYWFDAAQADIVASSFPSKVISYLTCGVPIFYHGPAAGTPAQLLARYPAGIVCPTQDGDGIVSALTSLIGSPARLQDAQRATQAALAQEFAPETLRRRLRQWLGDGERSQ